MGTNRLALYNNAARLLGSGELASLSENLPIRRRLDGIWDDLPLVDYCLEQGFWKFAKRSVRLDYDPSIDTSEMGGMQYAFQLPSDAVGFNNIKITSDSYFNSPIINFQIHGDLLVCDYQEIYMMYVSNDASFGGNLSIWTPSFSDYAAHELAYRANKRTTESTSDEDIISRKRDKALKVAKNKDALRDPVKFRQEGSWTRSRRSTYSDN